MLSGEGNTGEQWKTTIGLISKKATLHVQHNSFVYISLPFFCTTTTWNFQKRLSYTFYEGNVVRVLALSFSLPFIFTLHWWPLLTKKCLFCFLSLCSKSLSPFFSLSFAGLLPTSSFSLSFSCSIFQICGHDNLSELNTLNNTDTETISAFLFRLYWLFCHLCFTRRRWPCEFPPK